MYTKPFPQASNPEENIRSRPSKGKPDNINGQFWSYEDCRSQVKRGGVHSTKEYTKNQRTVE